MVLEYLRNAGLELDDLLGPFKDHFKADHFTGC